MKQSLSCLLLLLTLMGITSADETKSSDLLTINPSTMQELYFVTVTEYRLKDHIAAASTEAEIIKIVEEQKLEPVETTRLTANSREQSSMIQFGRQVTVAAVRVTTDKPTSHITQYVDIGTTVELKVASHARGVEAQIRFETKRQLGEGTGGLPPDVTTMSIETTQILELGKPRLIGSTSANETSYVFLTITKLP